MGTSKKLALLGLAGAMSLVAVFEGVSHTAYRDPVGVVTVCAGHTQGVVMGQTHTAAECKELLAADLLQANQALDQCVRVPLNANQRAALASFAFNVGTNAFCASTLVRKLNAGDYTGACNELPRWVYAGGRKDPLPGLVTRREKERQLCLSPVTGVG